MAIGDALQFYAMNMTHPKSVLQKSWMMLARLHVIDQEYLRVGGLSSIHKTEYLGAKFDVPDSYNLQGWRYSPTGEKAKTPLFIDIFDNNDQGYYFNLHDGTYPEDRVFLSNFSSVKAMACQCKSINEVMMRVESSYWEYNYESSDVAALRELYIKLE